MMSNTKEEARILLQNKKFKEAYQAYKKSFDSKDYQKDSFHYRNLNSILTCIHSYYLETKDNNLFHEFTAYFNEYIKIAENVETITWANNIVENLLEYAFEVAFIYFTENNNDFSIQRKKLQKWVDNHISSFIKHLYIDDKRNYKFFYDVILRILFKERTNFERKGNEYQNIVNTIFLGKYYLKLTDNSLYKKSRSNVYLLFSELIYNDPEQKEQEYFFLTQNAVAYLEKSLKEFPANLFAIKRKNQLVDSLTIQEQLHRFDHDVSSKMSTLNSLIQRLKRKAKNFNEPTQMERIIDGINIILNLSKKEVPTLQNVDILSVFDEIKNEYNFIKIKIESNGEKTYWSLNKGYFKIIFENLIKNSYEAYKRNLIKMPDPAIKIVTDFEKNKITLQDWGGGISDTLLKNDKLFEPYVSSKGVSQNTGLGLSLVKRACKKLSLEISYRVVNDSSTIVTVKKK